MLYNIPSFPSSYLWEQGPHVLYKFMLPECESLMYLMSRFMAGSLLDSRIEILAAFSAHLHGCLQAGADLE